jgi:hypothetical protein
MFAKARRIQGTRLAVGLAQGGGMYWIMVAIMASVGFGWVQVRRRRKASAKIA